MNNKNDLKKQEFYNYIIKMLSISKIGMVFSSDLNAKENFKQIHDLSIQMLEDFEHVKFDHHEFFRRSIYPTPNVSMRVAILNRKNEILLTRDNLNNTYSLPGGWCDLYDSPLESAENACYKQAGVKIKNINLLGIFNRTPFKQSINEVENKTVPEYLILVKAELDSKFLEEEHQDSVKFFNLDSLPELSNEFSKDEWLKLIDTAKNDIITIE